MSLEGLLRIIVAILCDESAVAVKAGLVSLQMCLANLLDSCHAQLALTLLFDLMAVHKNPYWLVKVHVGFFTQEIQDNDDRIAAVG